jgi:hypothetical protein
LVLRVVRLPLLFGLGLLLASKFGAMGMAWANVISGAAVVGVAVWLLCRYLGPFPIIWNVLKEKKSVT